MSNIQVTKDANPANARSESAILINPNNPQQIVSASKKFRNLHTYDFSLATAYSTDGGSSWNDSADFALPAGATVMTDPTLAWDDSGNVFMVGLVGNNPPTWDTIGIAVYTSTDGGKTWSAPNVIHTSTGDDKQWAAGDTNPGSPFHGRIYAVWDDGSAMRFARSLDHGASWIGVGTSSIAAGSLTGDSFSPEINVAANGDIYIVWIAGSTIKLLVSTDGGDTFHLATPPATGVSTLSAGLGNVHGWPVFPGGNYRVLTVPTACVIGDTVAVAWDDFRESVSRIYYALSLDGGMSWTTGAAGQPLLTGSVSPKLQHFFPQIIAKPGGVIGCALYEFGPKPTTNLIDVVMAESTDGGATFQPFLVSDQPWDPTVDAPWTHHADGTGIDASVTFIGDYFGIDASDEGFYPLWTDTRTGVQELWTAIVPERRCQFMIEKSTLGQDEIDARRKQPHGSSGGLPVPEAFRVVVDGFTAAEIGVAGTGSLLNVASPTAGMIVTCTGNASGTGGYGAEVQRFTFSYAIDFPDDSAFGFATATEFLTLNVALNATINGRAGSLTAHGQIELVKQPDPFILHGDPQWLSIDLRVFVARPGDSKFGVTQMGGDASDAPRFIGDIIKALTAGQGTAGGQSFEDPSVLSPDEQTSALFVQPTDSNNTKVFNFALAKVHYVGLIGAANVRVFFRLFRTQVTYVPFDYPPGGRYRRATSNPAGQPIPLAGIESGEYVTFPFFANPRVDSTTVGMDKQTDPNNVQSITAHLDGTEVDAYFGCWLDTNQPFKLDGVTHNNVLPLSVPSTQVDGPFGSATNPVSIQQGILRNSHQCLIAEIAFDPVAIPPGVDPSNWDKLAQRNIIWSDIGSAEAVSTFEFRPTQIGLPAGQMPDELMIDWGKTPPDEAAAVYIPSQDVDDILAIAKRMYTTHALKRLDNHTLTCPTGGITYIPIPPGAAINYPGLLSLDLPGHLSHGSVFTAVVRQVTNAFGWVGADKPPAKQVASRRRAAAAAQGVRQHIEWRRVVGAFQLSIPVKHRKELLLPEERQLSVMKWIGEAIPHDSRWFPVFQRYLQKLGGRVKSFGGDPGTIFPSPTGDGGRGHPKHPHPGGHEHERQHAFTGKIAGLLFDRFGDFEGFLLDTEDGEHRFFSREKEVKELSERAWRERLRLTVWAEADEPWRPMSIVVREPPAQFSG